MLRDVSEQLTAQFYKWEQRGRGWEVYPIPVDLEPPFVPFFGHIAPLVQHREYVDDGHRHTLLSGAVSLLKKVFKKEPEEEHPEEEDVVLPIPFDCDLPLTAFSIVQPKRQKVGAEGAEQLLTMLSYTAQLLSFEILANSERISFQLVCRSPDAGQVLSQLKAFFPECIVKEYPGGLDAIAGNGEYTSVIDYGLSDEFMRPLAVQKNFELDPFIGVCAVLEQLERGEHAAIQILFKGVVNPWAESIMRSVTDNGGKDFFENAPDMVPLAKEKIAAPLYGVAIKVIGEAEKGNRATDIALMVGKSLGRIFLSKSNSLIPLGGNYSIEDKVDDVFLRQSCRQGMLLNCKELATIVHLPSESVVSAKLQRNTRKTKPAPAITHGHPLVLGLNEHSGSTRTVSVSTSQRLKHTHVIGATGTGKSTMLQSMIVQDMQQGNGVAVLDPHGDLIENLLSHVPEHRLRDVIVFDPADAEYPVGFNILSAHSEVEKEILSSDFVAVFRRLSTSWGDQMNSVFANAILAFLKSNGSGTLLDLRRFLIEKEFRETFLKTVGDPNVVYYWQKEFPLMKSGSIGPILTRLDTFLRPKLIRNMVAQQKGLDFENILDGKILLVKLSQGLIGVENSYLLGTFFVSKFYQAATARQAKSKEARKDFFLYIDEFQNFITPSMSAILSGARKYHLGMILAHQEMQQLVKYDTELASSVVANAGTRICFRLADSDAKRFASGFSCFDQNDLENLNTGEAVGRVERPDYDFSLTTVPLPKQDEEKATSISARVIQYSREQYATPRGEVEALFQLLQTPENAPKAERATEIPPLPATQPQSDVAPVSALVTTPAISSDEEEKIRKSLRKKQEISQHRYLQTFIKQMAEARGYKVNIEELTPDGNGRVDVSLERNGKRIACEICVTTEKDWEVHNIEKCLAAGFDVVISCSSEQKIIEGLAKKIADSFNAHIRQRLHQFMPDQLIAFLDEEVAKDATAEKRVKGYRVKVKYAGLNDDEMSRKKSTVSKAILNSKSK